MKNRKRIILCLCALLLLSGCGRYPTRADDGTAWDQNWEMMGSSLGVEDPGNGFHLLENNVVLAADDTYYAAWVSGEPEPYTNTAGKEIDLYPAEIYLLYYGCKDEEAAAEAMQEWTERERASYQVLAEHTEHYNGQEYLIMEYQCASETNPYERGVSAFGLFHRYVISAELSCVKEFSGNEQQILYDFLSGFHFSSDRVR